MKNLHALDWIVIVLMIIGGLNWGILGIFDVNVVASIFGEGIISRIIYILVGISAVYLAILSMSLVKRGE
jgi:uncharacterized membrane protein YuzA (DUF378 family)